MASTKCHFLMFSSVFFLKMLFKRNCLFVKFCVQTVRMCTCVFKINYSYFDNLPSAKVTHYIFSNVQALSNKVKFIGGFEDIEELQKYYKLWCIFFVENYFPCHAVYCSYWLIAVVLFSADENVRRIFSFENASQVQSILSIYWSYLTSILILSIFHL